MGRQSAKIGSIAIILILIFVSIGYGIDMQGERVKRVATPIDPCDAATMQYVLDTYAAIGHNVLSAAHGDTENTGVPTRGSMMIANSTPKWAESTIGAAGTIWRSDGTDPSWAATTNITALGTIATGTWQATDVGVLYGGTGASSLNDLITLTTHTTGNYAAGDGEAGNALTGDSATAFFSSGTIEHEYGGLEADVSAYTGLLAISGGSTSEVDALSELEAQIADVTAFVVEGTACSDIEGTGLSITTGTLNWSAPSDSVTLTTHTVGNYVASITNGAGISGGDGGSEGASLTLAATLGTAIDTSEITDDTIAEADLNMVDSATDEDILTYESTGGDFEWHTIAELLGSTDTDSLPEGATNLYQLTEEEVEDYVGGMLAGVETLISVDYNDTANMIDFVVDEASIDHNALTNFVSGEHINWLACTNDVNTTGSGRFDGGIGVGVDPAGGVLLNITSSDDIATETRLDNTSTGDVVWNFLLGGSLKWTLGADNSDGDKFKIGQGVLGTKDTFEIDSSGNFEFNSGNFTGVGEITIVDGSSINLQEAINFTGATTENLIKMPDNLVVALAFREGLNPYLTFVTTDGGRKITLDEKLEAGTEEVEGSNFDINGGTMDGVTIATDCTQTEWDAAYDWGDHASGGYLKADGSVDLAGAWDMGSQALTNVNIDSGSLAGITSAVITGAGALLEIKDVTDFAADDLLLKLTGYTNRSWEFYVGLYNASAPTVGNYALIIKNATALASDIQLLPGTNAFVTVGDPDSIYSSSLRVFSTNYPVIDMVRDTAAVGTAIYAGARLKRVNSSPAAGGGIAFYFETPNDADESTYAGFFGGALPVITDGSEIGEIVFGAAYHAASPVAKRGLVIRAVDASNDEIRIPYRLKIGADAAPTVALDIDGTIKIKEQAAAESDTASYGQLWTKDNAGTTELWFTDDAGNDHQVAYVP